MAKYQITHACGHVQTHQIFGSNTKGQRDSKRDWLASCLCEDCYREEQRAKHDSANKVAAATNKANNLPSLVGTQKQIEWAESIRAKKVADLDNLLKPEFANGEYAEFYNQCQYIINTVKNQSSASYWINNKDKDFDAHWLQNQYQDNF